MNETRECKNCSKEFVIESDDLAFYERIQVSKPTWCSDCRQLRRYAWRNERILYRRDCDLCKKSTVTIYSPNKPYKVYCQSCWWGDGWDPTEYGKDFDFSRPFFEQFSELQKEVPRMALLSKNSVNSEYTNHSGDNKNAYISFACFGNENILYSTWVMNSRDCMDCSYIYEKGERLYQCIDTQSSYQSQYSMLLNNSSSCFYCYDVNGSTDCFLSSNLRNKRYVFKNRQLSKEEYLAEISLYDLSSFTVRQNLFQEFIDLVQHNTIHKAVVGERNVGCNGNLLFNCKNVSNSFDLDKSEDCKHIYGSLEIKDSMDIYHAGIKTELCYELHGCTRSYNNKFCHLCYDDSHLTYCDSCQNSQNLFGCVSIKKGQYCILNKKYSKEEYEKIQLQIIEHMKNTGEYGEFFPVAIAPVYFNETRANVYMPVDKETVLKKGWHWEEQVPGVFGKGSISMEQIPDSIKDIPDDFIKNIFTCLSCTKNYNVTVEEFAFYKREKIPLPRFCPDCRELKRVGLRLPRKLETRSCMCEKENHEHQDFCQNVFETAYNKERPGTVYCEDCYKQEVL